MKTTQRSITNNSKWKDLYQKVVTDIIQKETSQERVVKDALYEELQKTLKGKELVFNNSCKKYL